MDYEARVDLKIQYSIGEVSLSKNNIFFNQHEPDLINEIIAGSISKALYPVKSFYNEKGIVSRQINNHNEILGRWEKEKMKLLDKYESSDLNHFFAACDHQLSDKNKIERSLDYDWFWNLFFHPTLVHYGDYRSTSTELYLAIIPYQAPLRFLGTQTIEKIPTDYNSFKVDFKSFETVAPRPLYPKNASEKLKLWMSLEVNFDLDIYHHFPMHIRAYFTVYSKDSLGNITLFKRVEFTSYQINTEMYTTKSLSEDSPFITGGIVNYRQINGVSIISRRWKIIGSL